MNKLIILLSIFMFSSAFAKTTFGYVDMDTVMVSIDEGKKVFKLLNDEMASKQKELQDKEFILNKKFQEFQNNITIREEDKRSMIDALKKENIALEQLKAQYKQELTKKKTDMLSALVDKVSKVVDKLMKKNNIDYMFSNKALIMAPKGDDYTAELIKLYNKTYPIKE